MVVASVEVPATTKRVLGVDDPIPTLPFWRMVKSEVPVDDATLNGFKPDEPCTLKVMVEEVALTPATVPLSIKSPVPSVVAESQRVTKPVVPPLTPDAIA